MLTDSGVDADAVLAELREWLMVHLMSDGPWEMIDRAEDALAQQTALVIELRGRVRHAEYPGADILTPDHRAWWIAQEDAE